MRNTDRQAPQTNLIHLAVSNKRAVYTNQHIDPAYSAIKTNPSAKLDPNPNVNPNTNPNLTNTNPNRHPMPPMPNVYVLACQHIYISLLVVSHQQLDRQSILSLIDEQRTLVVQC